MLHSWFWVQEYCFVLPWLSVWWLFQWKEDCCRNFAMWFLVAHFVSWHSYLLSILWSLSKIGKFARHNEISLNPILVVEIFDVLSINYMCPLPMSHGCPYILVAVDYVIKWIDVVAWRSNDHKVVVNFLKENAFTRWAFLVQSLAMVENIFAIVHLKP